MAGGDDGFGGVCLAARDHAPRFTPLNDDPLGGRVRAHGPAQRLQGTPQGDRQHPRPAARPERARLMHGSPPGGERPRPRLGRRGAGLRPQPAQGRAHLRALECLVNESPVAGNDHPQGIGGAPSRRFREDNMPPKVRHCRRFLEGFKDPARDWQPPLDEILIRHGVAL